MAGPRPGTGHGACARRRRRGPDGPHDARSISGGIGIATCAASRSASGCHGHPGVRSHGRPGVPTGVETMAHEVTTRYLQPRHDRGVLTVVARPPGRCRGGTTGRMALGTGLRGHDTMRARRGCQMTSVWSLGVTARDATALAGTGLVSRICSAPRRVNLVRRSLAYPAFSIRSAAHPGSGASRHCPGIRVTAPAGYGVPSIDAAAVAS